MPRRNDPFRQPAKAAEVEQLVLSCSRRIDSIAFDLMQKASSDSTKDKLFKIKELAQTITTAVDYPGFGS